MKAVVAAFNQEKALVGAFSVITNFRMELFEALLDTQTQESEVCTCGHWTMELELCNGMEVDLISLLPQLC